MLEKVLICNRPHLIGNGIFSNKSIQGINVGDMIIQIGRWSANNKETSSSRRVIYDYPVTYVGCYYFQDKEWLVFQYDKREVPDPNGILEGKYLYAMFINCNTELIVPFYNKNETMSILIYPGHFVKTGTSEAVIETL